MSTRGLNFLHQWLSNNVPETARADVISIDELTHQLVGEEIDSLYRTILDAIVHFEPGSPEEHLS